MAVRSATAAAPPLVAASVALTALGAAALLAATWLWAGIAPGAVVGGGVGLLLAVLGQVMAAQRRDKGGRGGMHAISGLMAGLAACLLLPPLHGAARLLEPVLAGTLVLVWWSAGALLRAASATVSAPPVLSAGLGAIDQLRQTLAGQFLAGGVLALLARALHHPAGATAALLATAGIAAELLGGLWVLAFAVRHTLAADAGPPERGAHRLAAVAVALGLLVPAWGALAPQRRMPAIRPPATAPRQVPPHLSPRATGGAAARLAGLPVRPPLRWLPLADHVLSLAAAAVLALVIAGWLLRLWRAHGWARLGRWCRALLAALASLFTGLWGVGAQVARTGGMRAVLWWRPGGRRLRGGAAASRAGVRQAYRRLLRGARRRGWARPPAHSARRFGDRLAPRVGHAQGDLRALTALYEEARYSDHALGRGVAARASAYARATIRGLRGGGGGAPPPPPA